MQNVRKKCYFFFSSGLLVIFFLDTFTKWLVGRGEMKGIVFIKQFFYLTGLHKNDGIAFGISVPFWLQIIGSVVILFLLIKMGFEHLFKEKKSPLLESALLGMAVGGGLGNLLDRILSGYVTDFIVLGPIPIFNIADVGITVGLVLFFGTMLRKN